jgi:hypothetical protein
MNQRPETELIIIPGHGVCKHGFTNSVLAPLDSSWADIFPGEGCFYIEHCQKGVLLASENTNNLLVYSGGQTRENAGRRSEAESYFEISRDHNWWGNPFVANHTVMEEYARDSFENLLFSITLFKQQTGRWPEKVTIVGWIFKKKRFDLHRQALQWPKSRFLYIGVNNPDSEKLQEALTGEKNKVDSVTKDLFLMGPEWISQREQRDPFQRKYPYADVDPVLKTFFDFLDRKSFTSKFPWL